VGDARWCEMSPAGSLLRELGEDLGCGTCTLLLNAIAAATYLAWLRVPAASCDYGMATGLGMRS
jgi:hypothetical protein